MFENMDLFSLLKAAAGVYLIYGAITGRGKFFENEYPKCSREKYLIIMRLACLISGLIIIADGVLGFFAILEGMPVWKDVIFWVGMASIIAVIVLNVALTDRKAMEQARLKQEEEARRNYRHAAFDFEDEQEPEEDASGEGGEE